MNIAFKNESAFKTITTKNKAQVGEVGVAQYF